MGEVTEIEGRAAHCRVLLTDTSSNGGYFGKRYCRGKVTRDGLCTRHANEDDRQKERRRALATQATGHE